MPSSTPTCAVILSSAYLPPGLVAEFGLIPPAFLPLANRRLYEWQVESLKPHAAHVVLAVPDDFTPEAFDTAWLATDGVTLKHQSSRNSLGQAAQEAIAAAPDGADDIWLLFGDTLFADISKLPRNAIAVGHVKEHSNWGYCIKSPDGRVQFSEGVDTNAKDETPVVAGCFRLGRANFLSCLQYANNNFYAALDHYSTKYGLALHDTNGKWYDFGHTNAYFHSRQSFTTERKFNHLDIGARKVIKYSKDAEKITAEAAWFENVPQDMGVFLPRYLGRRTRDGVVGYATEYMFQNLISDLFVYGRLPEYVWGQILDACQEFLSVAHASVPNDVPSSDMAWLYGEKSQERLAQFAKQRGISLDQPWGYNGHKMPSLNDVLANVLKAIPPITTQDRAVMHGDFHFANIFFDFRSLGIKTVDPRGIVGRTPTIIGDRRYDIAKLTHSIDGMYDFIMAGILTAKVDGYDIHFNISKTKQVDKVQRRFASMTFDGISPTDKTIKAIVIVLYLSMLPLHAENKARQDTMLANIFRLYSEFV